MIIIDMGMQVDTRQAIMLTERDSHGAQTCHTVIELFMTRNNAEKTKRMLDLDTFMFTAVKDTERVVVDDTLNRKVKIFTSMHRNMNMIYLCTIVILCCPKTVRGD